MAGGGDDSDDLIREQERREEEERRRRREAIARLNVLFGIGPDDPGAAPKKILGGPTGGEVARAGHAALDMPGIPGMPKVPGVNINPAYATWEQQFQQFLEAEKNRKDRNRIYQRVAQDVRNFHEKDLSDQFEDTLRELKFELARRGHLGGSQELDQRDEAQRLFDKRLVEIANLGDMAATRARSADEQARLNAIRDINLGADENSAIQAALSQIGLNSQQATEFGQGQVLGDAFADLMYLYGRRREDEAVRRALAQRRSFTPSSGLSYSSPSYGTVT